MARTLLRKAIYVIGGAAVFLAIIILALKAYISWPG